MIKKIIITGLVVAATYVGSTWYMGQSAKNDLTKTVELSNEQVSKWFGDTVYYSLENYKENLFNSSATFRININFPKFKKQIDFDMSIQHGPLPWADISHGDFTPKRYSYESTLAKNEFVQPLLDIAPVPFSDKGYASFDGSNKGRYTIAPIKYNKRIGETQLGLEFAGLESDYSYKLVPYIVTAHTKLPLFHFTLEEHGRATEFNIKDWQTKTDVNLSNDLYNRSSDGHIDTMNYLIDGVSIDLANVTINDSMQDDGTLIAGTSTATAKDLLIDGIRLGGLTYSTSYDRLDSKSTKHFFTTLLSVFRPVLTKVDTITEKEIQELLGQQGLKLGALVFGLFNQGPSLTYGPIRLTNSKGSADLSMKFDFSPPNLSTLSDPNSTPDQFMFYFLNGIDVQVGASAPWYAEFLTNFVRLRYKFEKKELIDLSQFDFKKFSELLESAVVESELFKKEGDRFTLNIKAKAPEKQSLIEVDKINVNGQEIPLKEAINLLETRIAKATSLLESNGYMDELKRLMPEPEYDKYTEKYTGETTSAEELEPIDPATVCPADDQECIDIINELNQNMENAAEADHSTQTEPAHDAQKATP